MEVRVNQVRFLEAGLREVQEGQLMGKMDLQALWLDPEPAGRVDGKVGNILLFPQG